MKKPYSESCDQNKDPILSVISPLFSALSNVLEIGSGTGQHAVYFAEKMPHITWYCSDCKPYLEGINMWLAQAALPNAVAPYELNVSTSQWPELDVDAVFTANSVHIMHQQDVVNFINGVGKLLHQQGSLIIYGPFNYKGLYTSESNERFDQWLKDRDPLSGIKHFEEIESLANDNGMRLVTDYEMPANNRILHFIKT
jgi:cyclopropane fatty-acyl-phospholipid synthase-like methyltransferase